MLLILTILSLLFSAIALPTFSDFGSRAALVPDASHIHAVARRRQRPIETHALTLQNPGMQRSSQMLVSSSGSEPVP